MFPASSGQCAIARTLKPVTSVVGGSYLDQGEFQLSSSAKRNEIFRRELPLAIDAIRYGDHIFFETYPFLNQVPIVVNFISSYPQLAKREFWGNFKKASA